MGFKQIRVVSGGDESTRKRKSYRSTSQQKHFIQLWKASNKSQRSFCEQHNINIKTFSAWIKKANRDTHKASPLEANGPPPTLSQKATCFTLKFPNGALLSFTGMLEKRWLLSIIQEVLVCKFN